MTTGCFPASICINTKLFHSKFKCICSKPGLCYFHQTGLRACLQGICLANPCRRAQPKREYHPRAGGHGLQKIERGWASQGKDQCSELGAPWFVFQFLLPGFLGDQPLVTALMTTEKPMQTLPFPSPDLAEEDGRFTLLQPLAAGLVDHPRILGLTSPVHTESDNSWLEKVQSEPRRKVKNLAYKPVDQWWHHSLHGCWRTNLAGRAQPCG